ncbi:MAG: hypothetical protein WCA25_14135, partial [Pseudolabrys sp.]
MRHAEQRQQRVDRFKEARRRHIVQALRNAERSKPSPRIFGKRPGTPEAFGCSDNRGGVCLDGATSFVMQDPKPTHDPLQRP